MFSLRFRESDSVQAIEAFDTLAGSEELRLDYWLEAGDIQILNNHQIVHTRTHYEDWGVSGEGGRWMAHGWLCSDDVIHH